MTYAPLRDYSNTDAAEARDASEAFRATQCPPCTGRCNQGRQCAANTPAEPCSGIEEEDGYRRDFSPMARAIVWDVYLVILAVALIATAEVYWPR